jgi:putative oxidoreductase
MGFPAPTLSAWAAILAEVVAAGLIALGLLTRPSAIVLGFNMLVAAFLANTGWAAREMAMLFFAPSLLLSFTGAGRFSIDRLIHRGSPRNSA